MKLMDARHSGFKESTPQSFWQFPVRETGSDTTIAAKRKANMGQLACSASESRRIENIGCSPCLPAFFPPAPRSTGVG